MRVILFTLFMKFGGPPKKGRGRLYLHDHTHTLSTPLAPPPIGIFQHAPPAPRPPITHVPAGLTCLVTWILRPRAASGRSPRLPPLRPAFSRPTARPSRGRSPARRPARTPRAPGPRCRSPRAACRPCPCRRPAARPVPLPVAPAARAD